jgi:hypothetical protein
MAKPKVMHALLTESEQPLVAGQEYDTLCGTTWQHQVLSEAEVRERFVCALCHHEQVTELLAAITDLQASYNHHLAMYHVDGSTSDGQG